MKAIRVHETGGPQVLALEEAPAPEPGPGEARVRLAACGVNFIDTYHRSGLYKLPLPTGIGLEGAGVVDALGEGADQRLRPGQRVAFCSGPVGAYAEQHVVAADRLLALPDFISDTVAASALLRGLTASYLLNETFPVRPGHTVLVYSAAGGVGQILVQWARHLGALVIAQVGSPEKAEIAATLGAHHVIAGLDDIPGKVRGWTNGEGAHVVYDGVGRDTFQASLDSLRPRGMLVSFGNASGPPSDINPLILSQKGSLFLTRPTLGHYTATPEALRACAERFFAVLQSGAVRIAEPKLYALSEAAMAHADLEARATTGPVALIP